MFGISGKKFFFQNFNTFFCFVNDLSVIFGFLTPKLIKVPIFSEPNSKYERKCTTANFQYGHWENEREGLWSKFLIAISQKLFEIEAWNLVLLLIFILCTYAPNLIEIWKGGFQACPTLIWNSPKTFWGTTKKSENKNLNLIFISIKNFQKRTGREGLSKTVGNICSKNIRKMIRWNLNKDNVH